MGDKEVYLSWLLNKIEEIKAKQGRALYRVNDKITAETAFYVRDFFSSHPDYTIEIKSCATCKGTWDIIIYFHNLPY